MDGPLAGLAVFSCLAMSTLVGASAHGRVRDMIVARGSSVIMHRLLAIVAIMAAIFMALTTASLKTSFDTASREVKHFSSLVVELDRTLRRAGVASEGARELLFRYSDRVMKDTWPHAGPPAPAEPSDLLLLGDLETAVSTIHGASPAEQINITEARRLLQSVVETRWALEERAGRSMSPYLLTVLVFWLMLTFASLGFVAPRSKLMTSALLLGALSVGGAVFLLEEYDDPFDGLIVVSSEPVQNALFTMTD
jgi:hypothetical protein